MPSPKLRENILYYGSSQFFQQGVGWVRGFLVASILGPTYTGHLSIWGLFFVYGSLSQLGFQDGMYKLVGLVRGAGRTGEAASLRDSGALSVLGCALLYFLGCLVFAWWNYQGPFGLDQFGIGMAGLAVVLYHAYNLQGTLFRLNNDFKTVGLAQVCYTSTEFLWVMVFILPFGIYGVAAVSPLAFLAPIAYLFFRRKENFQIFWRWGSALRCWKAGFPLLLAGAAYTFLTTLDRLFIATNFSATEMGYYSMAATVVGLLPVFPIALASILYVRMLERVGKSGRETDLEALLKKSTLVLSVYSAFLVALLVPAVEVCMNLLLPLYKDSIPLTHALLLGAYSLSILHVAYNLLVAIERQRWILLAQGVCLGSALAAYIWIVHRDLGLLGIAWASSLIQTLYCWMVLALALSRYEKNGFRLSLIVLRYHLPFLYALGIHTLLGEVPASLEGAAFFWAQSLRVLGIGLAFLPVFVWLFRRYGWSFSQLTKIRL
ncbi:MAG TPA: lipopolysaccharide biosynthesis protein [Nitrospirales bacterium]|nr:lipopolysaccharide biosynthesis protein [Nitrospirales bacterium]